MNKILIIILCILVLIAVAPLLANGKGPTPATRYVVSTSKNAHPIAVNAGVRAWVGLDRAAAHSPVIKLIPGDRPPSDKIKPGKK